MDDERQKFAAMQLQHRVESLPCACGKRPVAKPQIPASPIETRHCEAVGKELGAMTIHSQWFKCGVCKEVHKCSVANQVDPIEQAQRIMA